MGAATWFLPFHSTTAMAPRRLSGHGLRLAVIVFFLILLAGCANYGTPKNVAIRDASVADSYSMHDWITKHSDNDIRLILTFSGGGTRAAALSYGVMQELRDTQIVEKGKRISLLDETDYISSVSGGSFTSAYYGLHGDGIFENFENDFLRFNLEKHLFWRTVNPFLLFSRQGRTESAIKYYQKTLFHDAVFADMIKQDHPMVIINASDLGHGIRFSFIQEYFDLLCSELAAYPVADAVAASSAVPVLFNPVVLKNYDTCAGMDLIGTANLRQAEDFYASEDLPIVVRQLKSYGEKDKRKYVHFVDGGITDNLGLRALIDIIAISGNPKNLSKNWRPPKHLVVIAVDAATQLETEMDESNKNPSSVKVASAVTKLQLTRYDADSMLLIRQLLEKWSAKLSTPEQPVATYLVSVDIKAVEDPAALEYLNSIPTSFSLDDEQVDKLIAAGRQLLRSDPEYQALLSALGGQ